MSYIHKSILDNINLYKSFLEQNINNLINYNINYSKINLFSTGEYRLFSIITENVRLDLNYLLSLNPDFDILGFPALKRNVRISIEAYYDLFNLVADRTYIEILKYQSQKINHVNRAIIQKYMPFLNRRKFTLNKSPLTIKEKATIAKNKNRLAPHIYKQMKEFATDSNSYIHPDIFVDPINNKDIVLKLLIFCDCRLIMYAFDLLNSFFAKYHAPYISIINPYDEYNRLYTAIASVPWIYL